MKTWLRWTLLVLTIGGGFTGLALVVQLLFRSEDVSATDIIIGIGAAVLYGFIIVSGLLFADNPKCTMPMIAAFGLQIPWISSPVVSYSLGAGARLSVGLAGWRFVLSYNIGSFVGITLFGPFHWGMGVNIFALFFFILLLRLRRRSKTPPELPVMVASSPAQQSAAQPGVGPTPGT